MNFLNLVLRKKISLIKLFILVGYVGVPLVTIVLFLYGEKSIRQFLFLVFMLFHSLERVSETFFTSKERKAFEFHGDWTLGVVTIAYLILCFLTITEFFLWPRSHKIEISICGVLLYLLAMRLRWWGMRSLGKQWAIHAVGARKIKKVRLIRIGAYKYIRHPIYLGVMLEVLSIPLIVNAYFSLIFSLLINVPLQFVRLRLEEKSSVRRFGEQYNKYKEEVDMLFPVKYLKMALTRKNVTR